MASPPPAVGQVRSSFRDILLALRSQILNSLGWDPTRVLVVADEEEDVPHLTGDQDVLIRPRGESPEAGVIDASGRVDNYRIRRATVFLRSRVLLDVVGDSVVRLTDQALGHTVLEDQICDAAEAFFALDNYQPGGSGPGNLMLACPARVGPLSEARRSRKHKEWVVSSFEVEFQYVRNLTQDPWPPS